MPNIENDLSVVYISTNLEVILSDSFTHFAILYLDSHWHLLTNDTQLIISLLILKCVADIMGIGYVHQALRRRNVHGLQSDRILVPF